MGDSTIRLAELLPSAAAALSLDVVDHRQLHLGNNRYGVLENNLTRKGIWSTDGGRDRASSQNTGQQEVFSFETDDVVGHLVMESSLGRLTVHEMETVSWILAKWVERESPEDPTIEFTLAELARDFGVQWGGSRAKFTKDVLRRLDRVRFTAEVWSHAHQTLVTEHFGIFDRVQIVERKKTRQAPTHGPAPVRVRLNEFIHQQLQAGQYRRYAWQILRGALTTPLAKRLYVFLDGQKGRLTPEGFLYEHAITEQLLATLGIRDRNLSRVRSTMRTACSEIATAERRYTRCEVRESNTGWVLSTLRTSS